MKFLLNPAAALIAAILPGAALANVTGNNVTINSGQYFSFETGTTNPVSPDMFLRTGTTQIAFFGRAEGEDLGDLGQTQFNFFTTCAGTLFNLATDISSLNIGPLVPGEIIAYRTNSGDLGALLVNTVSSGSININFITFTGGGGCPVVPYISAVVNNYSPVPAGFSNSGIAPGSLFVIKGDNLSTLAAPVLQNPAPPGLPNTLGGATVSVSVGGVTTQPVFYYAGSTQLALVMPSNTPTGSGTLTVTLNGQQSNAYPITVVGSSFGMLSADQTGTGSVKAVNPNNPANPYISFANPAPPGQTISIYGSGLGADVARDVQFARPTGAQISSLSAFYVGGMQVPIQYQGASGYPGLNQVNITLPLNVPTGCYVSIAGVTASGVPTNFLTMPIGTGACSDSDLGYNGSTISSLSGQATVKTGLVGVDYYTTPNASELPINTAAFAQFEQYTGAAYAAGTGIVSIGGCIVTEAVNIIGGPVATATPLNSGFITITSPNTDTSSFQVSGNINFLLPPGFLTVAGGTFPISATAGTTAPAVGAFSTQVVFPTPLLTWTNQSEDATVARSSGVSVKWSGGSPGTYVQIGGSSSTSEIVGNFLCVAPVGAGTFTVPPYVLAALPATDGAATLSVGNYTVPQPFTATGLDFAYAESYVNYLIYAVYQ